MFEIALHSRPAVPVLLQTESLSELLEKGQLDSAIFSSEDGFSPFGQWKQSLAEAIGSTVGLLERLAHRVHESAIPTICAIAATRPYAQLRGLLITAAETSNSYRRFASAGHGKQFRDFYYNVNYEAVAYACRVWATRRVGLTHLSAGGRFNQDVAGATTEALVHVLGSTESATLSSVSFLGCCIEADHFSNVGPIVTEASATRHRQIDVRCHRVSDAEFLELHWH